MKFLFVCLFLLFFLAHIWSLRWSSACLLTWRAINTELEKWGVCVYFRGCDIVLELRYHWLYKHSEAERLHPSLHSIKSVFSLELSLLHVSCSWMPWWPSRAIKQVLITFKDQILELSSSKAHIQLLRRWVILKISVGLVRKTKSHWDFIGQETFKNK